MSPKRNTQKKTHDMKNLIHTTNNAYDMTLLVEGEKVIGAWDYDAEQFAAETEESIQDWDANYPEDETIEAYGEIVEKK